MKRWGAFLLLLVLALSLCGCWDAIEVNGLAIVGAIGLDTDDTGRPIMGLEVLNPAALAHGAETPGGVGPEIVGWLLLEPAPTFVEALEQIARRVPRVPYLGHVGITIFGYQKAKGGIGRWLDYYQRNEMFRRSTLVSVCDTATGLLQRPFMEEMASLTLEGLVRSIEYTSMTRAVTLNEVLRRLAEPGIEPITMHTVGRKTWDIYVAREGTKSIQAVGQEGVVPRPTTPDPRAEVPPPVPPQENIQGSGVPQPEQTLFIGLSVFHGDVLRGFLDGLEARGFLWVEGKTALTFLPVQHPDNPTKSVVLQLYRSGSRYRPQLDGDKLTMHVEIDTRFVVAETDAPLDLMDPHVIASLEQAAAEVIEKEARTTLTRVQTELRSDIYGFGAEAHRRFPEYWRSVEQQWDDIFPELPVEFKINTDVHGGGLVLSPGIGRVKRPYR